MKAGQNIYTGTGPGGFFWNLLGNSGTVDGTNFQGSIDNVPVTYRVNNTMSGRVDNVKRNTFWGFNAGGTLYNQVTGVDNTLIGNNAGKAMIQGVRCVFVGSGAGALFAGTALQNSQDNVGIGYNALGSLTRDYGNTAVGFGALSFQITGVGNTAVGDLAGGTVTTGQGLSFFGLGADVTVGTEQNSTAVGYGAIITASNEFVFGSTGASVTRLRYIYSGAGATHSEFFRTSTPEAAQTGVRGDIAYVNDGATGSLFLKVTGTGNTGWLALAIGSQYLPLAGGTMSGAIITTTQNSFQVGPFGVAAGNTGEIRFLELAAGGTNYIGFKGADSRTTNLILQLPAADPTLGQVLTAGTPAGGVSVLTWGVPTPVLTATEVAYGSAANLMTSDANFTRQDVSGGFATSIASLVPDGRQADISLSFGVGVSLDTFDIGQVNVSKILLAPTTGVTFWSDLGLYTFPRNHGTVGQTFVDDGAGNLSFGTIVSSQWVTAGSDIYYSAGNVGIGGAPSTFFEVIGANITLNHNDTDISYYWAFGSEGIFYVGTGSGSTATSMKGLMLNVKGAKYQLGNTVSGSYLEISDTPGDFNIVASGVINMNGAATYTGTVSGAAAKNVVNGLIIN